MFLRICYNPFINSITSYSYLLFPVSFVGYYNQYNSLSKCSYQHSRPNTFDLNICNITKDNPNWDPN
uniref:Uncharacterized protein n=1 Tax=Rhizophora mucronata TaxID=61149 RepID=A0A2P2NLQ8_RHIMU